VFRSRLAEFEAEFDANPLLLHINHFNRSLRSQKSTNTTSQTCIKKTYPRSRRPLSRTIHNGLSSTYLAAHNCTTSGFRAAFKFREILGSSSKEWQPEILRKVGLQVVQTRNYLGELALDGMIVLECIL